MFWLANFTSVKNVENNQRKFLYHAPRWQQHLYIYTFVVCVYNITWIVTETVVSSWQEYELATVYNQCGEINLYKLREDFTKI